MTHKNRNKKLSCFEVLGCLLLKAEGFFCSLHVLYEGLGISKLQFQSKNDQLKFCAQNYRHSFRENKPKALVFYD